MVYEFKVKDTTYFFDGDALLLYKNKMETSIKLPSAPLKDENTLEKVMIIVSNVCNGECVYCYENGSKMKYEKTLMQKNVANKIIIRLAGEYKRINKVAFFGGEPLLNFEIIKYIVEELESKMEIKQYEITTNAIFMTRSIVRFLEKYKFRVVISLDGPEKIHNKLRINCPYNEVMQKINTLKESTIKNNVILNCTLTKYHLEHIRHKELNKFFENIGLKFAISYVISNIPELKIDQTIDAEKEKIIQSYKNLCDSPLVQEVSEYVKPVIMGLIERLYHPVFCSDLEQDGQIVFDIRGDAYPCMNLLYKIRLADECIKEYNYKENEKCQKCWAKGICTDCIGPYITKEKVAPYNQIECYRKELYSYSLKKFIYFYQEDTKKFEKIIRNFYQKED